MNNVTKLIYAFKQEASSSSIDAAEITSAMVLMLYELAINRAALRQTTPSEELSKLIEIMEDSFGEYLEDHAEHITMINTIGDLLMGRK